jgi:hypothetical protein
MRARRGTTARRLPGAMLTARAACLALSCGLLTATSSAQAVGLPSIRISATSPAPAVSVRPPAVTGKGSLDPSKKMPDAPVEVPQTAPPAPVEAKRPAPPKSSPAVKVKASPPPPARPPLATPAPSAGSPTAHSIASSPPATSRPPAAASRAVAVRRDGARAGAAGKRGGTETRGPGGRSDGSPQTGTLAGHGSNLASSVVAQPAPTAGGGVATASSPSPAAQVQPARPAGGASILGGDFGPTARAAALGTILVLLTGALLVACLFAQGLGVRPLSLGGRYHPSRRWKRRRRPR